MLKIFDVVLVILHVAVIVFNCTGWIWQQTRKWHLWLIGITAFSWFMLGWKYGWGYCFLTDWSWQIKRKLGETDLPNSFIQYGIEKLGISVPTGTTDLITVIIFGLCITISVILNISDHQKKLKGYQ